MTRRVKRYKSVKGGMKRARSPTDSNVNSRAARTVVPVISPPAPPATSATSQTASQQRDLFLAMYPGILSRPAALAAPSQLTAIAVHPSAFSPASGLPPSTAQLARRSAFAALGASAFPSFAALGAAPSPVTGLRRTYSYPPSSSSARGVPTFPPYRAAGFGVGPLPTPIKVFPPSDAPAGYLSYHEDPAAPSHIRIATDDAVPSIDDMTLVKYNSDSRTITPFIEGADSIDLGESLGYLHAPSQVFFPTADIWPRQGMADFARAPQASQWRADLTELPPEDALIDEPVLGPDIVHKFRHDKYVVKDVAISNRGFIAGKHLRIREISPIAIGSYQSPHYNRFAARFKPTDNIMLVYHGASLQAVNAIAQNGFKPHEIYRARGAYGRGTYVAVLPHDAAVYAANAGESNGRVNVRSIIVSALRVTPETLHRSTANMRVLPSNYLVIPSVGDLLPMFVLAVEVPDENRSVISAVPTRDLPYAENRAYLSMPYGSSHTGGNNKKKTKKNKTHCGLYSKILLSPTGKESCLKI